MIFPRLSLVVTLGSFALSAPAISQERKLDDPSKLSCGQKVLVKDQTCPKDEVLEITGSCIESKTTKGRLAKGLQYNCIKRK